MLTKLPTNIYLYRPWIDFRKSIHGLCAVIQNEMNINPYKDAIFAFTNRSFDKIKILYWDRTGFALWYKVLDKDKFPWPKKLTINNIVLKEQELQYLLCGIDLWSIKPHDPIDRS